MKNTVKPFQILFVCVYNAARSQMAEAWAKKLLPSTVRVWSAGLTPATAVSSSAIQVMKEVGVDLTPFRPKSLTEIPLHSVNLAITLCEEASCLTLPPHITVEAWTMPDPGSQLEGNDPLTAFRRVRDDLRLRIVALGKCLTTS